MNPFELYAELTRQWLGLASTMAASAVSATQACMAQAQRAAYVASPVSLPGSWLVNPFMAPPMAMSWAPWQPASMTGFPFMQPAAPAVWPWMLFGAMGAAYAMPMGRPGDLIEQMVTNYRTVSGYAVAAIVTPLGGKDLDTDWRRTGWSH